MFCFLYLNKGSFRWEGDLVVIFVVYNTKIPGHTGADLDWIKCKVNSILMLTIDVVYSQHFHSEYLRKIYRSTLLLTHQFLKFQAIISKVDLF